MRAHFLSFPDKVKPLSRRIAALYTSKPGSDNFTERTNGDWMSGEDAGLGSHLRQFSIQLYVIILSEVNNFRGTEAAAYPELE